MTAFDTTESDVDAFVATIRARPACPGWSAIQPGFREQRARLDQGRADGVT